MARPKEFERDIALQQAIGIFADHGFEGTSTDDLLKAMGISRQSLYDTFGDKWHLYLEALQRYTTDSIGEQLGTLNAPPLAIEGLRAHLNAEAEKAISDPSPACLGVSAVCEFGHSKPEVVMMTKIADRALSSALQRKIEQAKVNGDIRPALDVSEAAAFIAATLIGIKVSARSGASPESLRAIARMAIDGLR